MEIALGKELRLASFLAEYNPVKKLKQKIQELMRQKSLLENTIHMTEYAATEPLNKPKIVEYEEEYFIVTKTDLGIMEIEEISGGVINANPL